jgi:putative ABC transport system permease protein
MLSLALAFLRDRPLVSGLNILLLALATALLAFLLLVTSQIAERLEGNSRNIDLVVGAKGSPLQLVLSAVHHVDTPTGNIPYDRLALIRSDPLVARAVPLALGDNFRGFRIVGTEPAFLDIHGVRVAEGRMGARAHDALVGATAARRTGLAPGQRFVGSHGFGSDGHAHEDVPYTVTGVLAPTGTVVDRLILTSVEAVWDAHGIGHDHADDDAHDHGRAHGGGKPDEHDHNHGGDHGHDHGGDHGHGAADARAGPGASAGPAPSAAPGLPVQTALGQEVTAILVTYANAAAAVRLPSIINRGTDMQAAVPALETARLLSIVGVSVEAVRWLGLVIAAVGGLAIFVAIRAAAEARAGDLALMRVMGASRAEVSGTIMLEGTLQAAAGATLGLLLAHLLLWVAARTNRTLGDIGLDPLAFHPGEALIWLAVVGIGALAALLPAVRVSGQDLAPALARAT